MKLKTLILTGLIMSFAFCTYAQEETANDEWLHDFRARRDAALEEYRSQGLSQEEIREKMASFRDEAQNYREANGLKGEGNKNQNRNGSSNGPKDGSGNKKQDKKQYRHKKGNSSEVQSGSGNRYRRGSGGGRSGGGRRGR